MSKRRRTDIINYLIVLNGYQSYLEIGVAGGDNFKEIIANRKVGVDPQPYCSELVGMTSDQFFLKNHEKFDIIFIDGWHQYEQVLRDVDNGIKFLNPSGIIVMHDCLPVLEIHQSRNPVPGAWNGDVWKAAAYIRMNYENVSFCVLDTDWGCGLLIPHSSQELFPKLTLSEMDWTYYMNNKNKILNVKTIEGWLGL